MALNGTPGDDTLEGGFFTDTSADGGAGNDLLILNYSGADLEGRAATSVSLSDVINASYNHLRVDLSDGTQTVLLYLYNIERYDVTGSAGDDNLGGDAGNDILRGGAGDDFLNGYGGADILDGGEGNDRFGVTSSNTSSDQIGDRIDGGSGIEWISRLDLSSLAEAITLTSGSGLNLALSDGTKIIGKILAAWVTRWVGCRGAGGTCVSAISIQ